MHKVKVAGLDPGFCNFGIALFDLDLGTMELDLLDLMLIESEPETKTKVVRKNSDDLRRAIHQRKGFFNAVKGCAVGFAEIPSGAQDSRAAMGFGISIGLVACSPIPIIQVQVADAKMAAVGTKTASKEEMIEWAMERYPDGPWLMKKRKGVLSPTAKNEHMADACAIAQAGLQTAEFEQLASMLRHRTLAAA